MPLTPPTPGAARGEPERPRPYDPPADLSPDEVTLLGQALTSHLSRLAQEHSRLAAEMRAAAADGAFTDEQVAEAIARERARLARVYETVCRFVIDPLPFRFFEAIADREPTHR